MIQKMESGAMLPTANPSFAPGFLHDFEQAASDL